MKLFWVGEEMKLEMCLMWFYCANQFIFIAEKALSTDAVATGRNDPS
jgi:hypothetical protein